MSLGQNSTSSDIVQTLTEQITKLIDNHHALKKKTQALEQNLTQHQKHIQALLDQKQTTLTTMQDIVHEIKQLTEHGLTEHQRTSQTAE